MTCYALDIFCMLWKQLLNNITKFALHSCLHITSFIYIQIDLVFIEHISQYAFKKCLVPFCNVKMNAQSVLNEEQSCTNENYLFMVKMYLKWCVMSQNTYIFNTQFKNKTADI